MSQPKFFEPTPEVISQPRKTYETTIVETVSPSNRFPIYWPRILEILKEYEDLEKKFKDDPKWFKTHDIDTADFKHPGMPITRLTKALAQRVSNSDLKKRDYFGLLEIMSHPYSHYIHYYQDKDQNERCYITRFGKLFLEEKENNTIMADYWELVSDASKPRPHKGKITDLMRRH